MRFYHIKAINEAINIKDLIISYGIEINSRNQLLCPDLAHKDTVKSASIKNNICHCFGCNKSFSPVDIVIAREGKSFSEACKTLCDRYNLTGSMFYENNEKDGFPLSYKEIIALGLENNEKTIKLPVGINETKNIEKADEVSTHYFYQGEEVTKEELQSMGKVKPYDFDTFSIGKEITYETIHTGLKKLWQEDKEAFNDLVIRKSNERIKLFKEALASLTSDPALKNLCLKINNNIKICENILGKFKNQELEIECCNEEELEER